MHNISIICYKNDISNVYYSNLFVIDKRLKYCYMIDDIIVDQNLQ